MEGMSPSCMGRRYPVEVISRVVVAEAYEAAGVARQLADPGAAHLLPVYLDLCRRYRDLRAWVNSDV